MATKKTISRTCPECSTNFDTEAYEVINVTLDTALRDEVIWGRIFDFTCPACEKRFRSPYSMAYKDMEREVIIFLDLHEDDEKNITTRKDEEKMTSLESEILESLKLFPNYRIRVVNNMMDLIEKIHIFSAGLNDKIITYLGYKIKDDINVKMKTKKEPIQVHKALFDSLKGKEGIINFGLFSTSPKPIFVSTPIREYKYLFKKSPICQEFEEVDGLYRIDERWAAEIEKMLIA